MWRRLILAASVAALAGGRAGADPLTVTGALTVNFLDGTHNTGQTVDALRFAPLPLAELNVSAQRTMLHLESFPAVSFSYGDGSQQQTTRLSIINATLRRSFAGGFFVGAGQTVYNQLTAYQPSQDRFSLISAQSSRVTGARFEAGIVCALPRAARIEYVFGVNPVMRGVQRTAFADILRAPQDAAPERAEQIDTSVRWLRPAGPGAVIIGLRYLNYASRYDVRGPANGVLADRNAGILPLVGYQLGLH